MTEGNQGKTDQKVQKRTYGKESEGKEKKGKGKKKKGTDKMGEGMERMKKEIQ